MPVLFEPADLWSYLFEIKCDACFLAAEHLDRAEAQR